MAPRCRSSVRGMMRAKQPLVQCTRRPDSNGNCSHRRCSSKLQFADTVLGKLQERSDLRLAEAVDRLHRIADAKYAAPVAALPAGRQIAAPIRAARPRYPEIRPAEMLQAIVETQAQIGRRVGAARGAQRRQRYGREIHRTLLAEDTRPVPPRPAPAPAPRRERVPNLRRRRPGIGRSREAPPGRGPRRGRALEFLPGDRSSAPSLRTAGKAVVLGEAACAARRRGQEQIGHGVRQRVSVATARRGEPSSAPARSPDPAASRARAARGIAHKRDRRSDPLAPRDVARAISTRDTRSAKSSSKCCADAVQLRLIERARRPQAVPPAAAASGRGSAACRR